MYQLNNWPRGKPLRQYLRHKCTKAEALLWSRLRRKRIGYKFRRQHGFGKYIMDFYCPALLLAIEVDGSVHGASHTQVQRDEIRQRYLEDYGITVLRVRNEQVFEDLDAVVKFIQNECDRLTTV